MTTDFNALDYAQQLQAAGVPKEQADVHAKILADVLEKVAFARDLGKTEAGLKHEILQSAERVMHGTELVNTSLSSRMEQMRIALNARIEQVGIELNARIEQIRIELSAKIDTTEASLRSELKLHRWMLGTVIAFNIAILAKQFFA